MKNTLAPPKRPFSQVPAKFQSSRTKLGGILRKIRRDIVASGAALLDWDALDREIAERRGDQSGEAHR